MTKLHEAYTLLTIAGVTSTGTALSYGNTDKATITVAITGSTGTSTVVIYGSLATTSTGTYSVIDTTTSTGANTYDVQITGNYHWIKASCTAVSSTGVVGTVNIITSGEGY